MDYKPTRTLAALLAGMLLLSACAEDTTPGDNPAAETQSSDATSAATEVTETKPEVNWQTTGIAKEDFGGRTFNVLLADYTNPYAWHYVALDESTGEVLNDAIVKRNQTIEAEFNVDITETEVKETLQALRTTAMSNDGAYDTSLQPITQTFTLAKEGYLIDWYDLPNVNLDAPWWDQDAVTQLNLRGHLYYCIGDISPLTNIRVFSLVFNKDLCHALGLDMPYDAVFEGKWTYDLFSQYIAKVNQDTNGDGEMNYDDRWGFFSQNGSSWMMYIGGGGRVLELTEDKTLSLAANTEANVDRAVKALEIINDKNQTLMADPLVSQNGGSWTAASTWFAAGNALMRSSTFEPVPRDYRSMDVNFGVLPFPKYDEAQENYCTPMETEANMFAIPLTADAYFVGTMLELLSAESVETVSVAFYDKCLEGKAVRDVESTDVLDIIFSTKVFDYGLIAKIPDFRGLMSGLESKGTSDYVSSMKSNQKIAERNIKKLMEAYDDLEAKAEQ